MNLYTHDTTRRLASRFDSAGIEIVSSPFNPGPVGVLSGEPTWSLGGLEAGGPTNFSEVGMVYGHPDGGIWVSERQSRHIEVFAHDGSHRFTVGGAGDGPAEFRRLRLLGGDSSGTVLAFDAADGSLLSYSGDGGLNWSASWPVGEGSLPNLTGVKSGGKYVGWISEPIQRSELADGDIVGDSVTYSIWDSPGATPASIIRVAWPGSIYSTTERGVPLPFRTLPGVATRDLGYFTSGPRFEVQGFQDTDLARIVRIQVPAQEVSSEQVQAYMGSVEAQAPAGPRRRALVAALEHPRTPRFLTAFDAVLVTDEGGLWARRWSPSDMQRRTWEVFAPDGSHLGHVAVPIAFSPRVLRGDAVIGLFTDDFDVTYLRQYSLSTPE